VADASSKPSVDLVGPGAKATTVRRTGICAAPTVCGGDTPPTPSTCVLGLGEELPAVLAGPIVRRSTTQEICLWVCLSAPAGVEARVFVDSPDNPLAVQQDSTWPFGERLHVALVRVPCGDSPFPQDQLISYTMKFTAKAGFDFSGDVAFNPPELAYGGAQFPALVLPSEQTDSVIIQGSCRKIHGWGEDAISQADSFMASHSGATSRAQQLLFTGDQIYADDVLPAALSLAQKLGILVFGRDERLPTSGGKSISAAAQKGGNRGPLVRQGFTSDASVCGSHAMAFYDFMMLYLLGWSGDVWNLVSAHFADEFSELNQAKFHAPAIQRLMANVPTYMICDDHEVTDDWFIDQKFFDDVMGNPMLKRVLTNALVAYWLFQGWGNAPDAFGDLRPFVSDYLVKGDTGVERRIHGRPWAFVTPAPAAVIFLDTRTRRVLHNPDLLGMFTPAELLNGSALADLASVLSDPARRSDLPVLMVSPPPVFDMSVVEWAQQKASFTRDQALENDLESWSANGAGFWAFLRALDASPHAQFVIFAGDVHFATAIFATALFAKSLLGKPDRLDVLHLTSSAIKNAPDPKALDHLHMANIVQTEAAADEDSDTPDAVVRYTLQKLTGSSFEIHKNNVGIFTMTRTGSNVSAVRVTNTFVDSDGGTFQTAGAWGTLFK
jgi:hypothetical protein